MSQPVELMALRDEALRKIGRNVVNFQKVEACLKYLIAVRDVQDAQDGLRAQHKKRTAQIQRLPLGQLSEAFYQCIYGAEPEAVAQLDHSRIWLSTSFRIESDAATLKKQKRALSTLVTERNRLIHRDLSGFNHASVSSCRNLIVTLDAQNERILGQLEELKTYIEAFREHIAALKVWADGDGPDLLAHQVSDDA